MLNADTQTCSFCVQRCSCSRDELRRGCRPIRSYLSRDCAPVGCGCFHTQRLAMSHPRPRTADSSTSITVTCHASQDVTYSLRKTTEPARPRSDAHSTALHAAAATPSQLKQCS